MRIFYELVLSLCYLFWQEKNGCCWLCRAMPQDVRAPQIEASWRKQRYSHHDLMLYLRQHRGHVSPIFGCPFLLNKCFKVDWLHCCDLGVAADFLGNLFQTLLHIVPGNTKAERCTYLYRRMFEWYQQNNVSDRLPFLTLTMIQKSPSKPPKLRAKAAEARALIPFGVFISSAFLDANDTVHCAILSAAKHLSDCYANLARSSYDPEKIRAASRKFCLQYCSLETHFGPDSVLWRLKPKFHLFQELCEMSRSCPSLFWTYRDEDFGGALSHFARRRGAPCTAPVAAQTIIDRFVLSSPTLDLQ